jgi:hypothetical protein
MTEAKRNQMKSRMRRLCREAIRTFAKKYGLTVQPFEKQLQIVGTNGFICDTPHGERLNAGGNYSDFQPGYGKEGDWDDFFKRGVCLAWVHTTAPATGDNFDPTNEKDAMETLEMLGLSISLTQEKSAPAPLQ